jgi:class 3 adenylate cyclase/tetratricopeptide (TPR) repeat protein
VDFVAVVDQVIALLRQRGRVTYRTLKRQFQLDDESLEDLKEELIVGQRLAEDEAGRVLVWIGGAETLPSAPPSSEPQALQPAPPEAAFRQTAPPLVTPANAAERRQLTVLFCDLVDSTVLATQLDPEDLREVVRAYQEACTKVIARFEGHIAQYLGDGLLVYFGYPLAHEDDAQRAVRAGLGIVEAMGQLNTRLTQERGVQLAARLGIHTGLVVVGEVGGGARQEQLALGETPNLAARLQGLAAPNTLVISAATARLVEGYFVYQPLEAQALKGVSPPHQAFRVLQASGAQTRLDVITLRGFTPLVGREEEVALLHARWGHATRGRGQVVLLSGEPGIGKSRLVQVLKDAVAAEAHILIEWRGSPYYQQSALHPVIDHLHRRLQGPPGEPPAATLHTLEAMLTVAGVGLAEAVPLLAARLSLPLPASYPLLTLTPQRQRQRTFDTLLAWLHAEAQRQPVLMVVEDLHWLDPSTVELLSLLVEQGAQARLCLILTARPEFRHPWDMMAHVTALTLRRLAPDQVAQVATEVAGHKTLPAEIMAQIVAKTDGVPLFVEELTQMVLESGLLQEREAHYELPGPLPPLAIPSTLQDALLARLDRLAAAKGVAQLGATIGRTFAYDLLQAVTTLDGTTLQGALAQLVEAGVVAQRGHPPQATYIFKHALIQETAYQSLLKSMRQQVHQRIAQVIETQFPALVETQPGLLAHHALRGELWDQALAYCRQAGDTALAYSAHREAVAYFEQALRALAQLPEQRATCAQAIDLRLALRTALLPSGDFERILALLCEAEALATTLDDPQRLAQVSGFLSLHFSFMGAHDQAITAAQRVLALATAGGDVVLHALANFYLGINYWDLGDYCRAIDCHKQTMASFDEAWHRERFGLIFLPAVDSRTTLAHCYAELGMFAEGRTLGEEGLQIAEAAAHPASLMWAYYGIGLLSLRQGDLPRALPLLERAVGICKDAALSAWDLWMTATLGTAYTLAGRVADAVPLLTQAMEQTVETRMVIDQTRCRLFLGEAQLLAGHLEEAQALAERAQALARAHQERGHEAYARYLLGAVAARRDPLAMALAKAHYRQALALAEELGMRPLQAHCHRGLGTLYAQAGQREQARTELATAIELYRAMDMAFWLPETKAALAQVEGR